MNVLEPTLERIGGLLYGAWGRLRALRYRLPVGVTGPEAHLRRHLAETRGPLEFDVRPMGRGAGIEGWSFFRAVVAGAHDAVPAYYVVRADGTVVADDSTGELAAIYRSMGVLDAEEPPATEMAFAATALRFDGTALVDGEFLEPFPDRYRERDLAPPETRRAGEDLVLEFSVRGLGMDPGLYECTVTVSPGYDIAVDRRALE